VEPTMSVNRKVTVPVGSDADSRGCVPVAVRSAATSCSRGGRRSLGRAGRRVRGYEGASIPASTPAADPPQPGHSLGRGRRGSAAAVLSSPSQDVSRLVAHDGSDPSGGHGGIAARKAVERNGVAGGEVHAEVSPPSVLEFRAPRTVVARRAVDQAGANHVFEVAAGGDTGHADHLPGGRPKGRRRPARLRSPRPGSLGSSPWKGGRPGWPHGVEDPVDLRLTAGVPSACHSGLGRPRTPRVDRAAPDSSCHGSGLGAASGAGDRDRTGMASLEGWGRCVVSLLVRGSADSTRAFQLP